MNNSKTDTSSPPRASPSAAELRALLAEAGERGRQSEPRLVSASFLRAAACLAGLTLVVVCSLVAVLTNLQGGAGAGGRLLVLGGETQTGPTRQLELLELGHCPANNTNPVPALPRILANLSAAHLADRAAVRVCGLEDGLTACFLLNSGAAHWVRAEAEQGGAGRQMQTAGQCGPRLGAAIVILDNQQQLLVGGRR